MARKSYTAAAIPKILSGGWIVYGAASIRAALTADH
jgi:hypothetical protein